MPQALVQLVRTRWLAWGKAVGVILSQWLELKTHFQVLSNQNDPNENECFSEPNYLFLLFVHPIATEVNRINLAFQAREAEWLRYDPGELQVTALLAELHDLVLWVARKVCRPEAVPNNEQGAVLTDAQQEMLRVSLDDPQCILPLAQVDYGPKFSIHLGTVVIDPPLLKEIQTRCRSYLIVLAKNILQVLPEHGSRLAALRHFHPEECLRRGPQRARVLQLPLYLAGNDKPSYCSQTKNRSVLIIECSQHLAPTWTSSRGSGTPYPTPTGKTTLAGKFHQPPSRSGRACGRTRGSASAPSSSSPGLRSERKASPSLMRWWSRHSA
ncbi:3-dehydroquinate synthase [Frankliniella fusca]|uniref:3-dehydroquinate synthase n=1 Tax=Frankliniella fusca TaxID=407009 RepID=A0AAE1GYH7_9NEOP|nr:3-dehydroquinate synthase [Frankliniella fusca]